MSIDTFKEQVISIDEAAKHIGQLTGQKRNRAVITRWASRGVAGVKAAAYIVVTCDYQFLLKAGPDFRFEEMGPMCPAEGKGVENPPRDWIDADEDNFAPLTVFVDPGNASSDSVAKLFVRLDPHFRAVGRSGLRVASVKIRYFKGELV